MPPLSVYFARAMDARPLKDIVADDEKYARLLGKIDGVLMNPFQQRPQDLIQDASKVVERDLANLKNSSVVLADLSIPDYQYVGCIFEIVCAATHNLPVVLVTGEKDLHKRVFFQTYCDFITRDATEAVNYIFRAHTQLGTEQQMIEMQAYYDSIALNYMDKSVRTHRLNKQDAETHRRERTQLRAVIRQYSKGSVCQIGIGTGDWTETICQVADKVIGVEVSPAMLKQARKNLSSYNNIRFLHCDALKEDISGGPFDCVVAYFLLSLLPRSMQDKLFSHVRRILKPGGLFIIADTRRPGDLPAQGLGRRQLQERKTKGKVFTLYKEHFVGDSLTRLLENKGYAVVAANEETAWFSWAVVHHRATEST
jgi:ubiquinone/menaquinone biosynthesis C-methylase UbiE